MDVRTCPECDAEYLPHVTTCAGCGVPTIAACEQGYDDEAIGQGPAIAPPGQAEMVPVRKADLAWCQDLAERLQERGIPCLIASPPPEDCATGSCQPSYLVLVPREAEEAARRVDHEHVQAAVPDALTSLDEVASDTCPACGSALGEDAAECPECGLAFGPLEAAG